LPRNTADTHLLEIFSHPRLGHTPWQTHATAKIVAGAGHSDPNVSFPRDDTRHMTSRDMSPTKAIDCWISSSAMVA
jgi:hypothetical protein